jgi:hypothetical protein
MAERTKKPKDDSAVTAMHLVEMNETRDYVARGRTFKGLQDADAIDMWVAAFEKLFVVRTPEVKLMVDDIQAELRLRKLEPPADRIRTILEKSRAESLKPSAANDARWADLERKFEEALSGLTKPKN